MSTRSNVDDAVPKDQPPADKGARHVPCVACGCELCRRCRLPRGIRRTALSVGNLRVKVSGSARLAGSSFQFAPACSKTASSGVRNVGQIRSGSGDLVLSARTAAVRISPENITLPPLGSSLSRRHCPYGNNSALRNAHFAACGRRAVDRQNYRINDSELGINGFTRPGPHRRNEPRLSVSTNFTWIRGGA